MTLHQNQLEIKVHITNGLLITAANQHKIVAEAVHAGTCIRAAGIDPSTYRERYTVHREAAGYIFREVTVNTGFSGHYDTLRELIIATLHSPDFRVFVEEEKA